MKNIFICIVFLLSFYKGFSQTTFSLRAGSNVSTVFTKDYGSGTAYETNVREPVTGYYIGVFTTIYLDEKIDFRPELSLSRKGFRSEMPRLDGNSTITRLYYLNLPLLLSFKPSEKISLLIGPELGYLLKSSAKNKRSKDYDSFDSKRRNDFGIALGMSYLLVPAFEVEVRYSHGFSPLSPYKSLIGMQNRSIQLGVAYNLFAIK